LKLVELFLLPGYGSVEDLQSKKRLASTSNQWANYQLTADSWQQGQRSSRFRSILWDWIKCDSIKFKVRTHNSL